MFCTKCGNANGEGARFCVKCGAPLVAPAGPSLTPAEPVGMPPEAAAPAAPAPGIAATVRTAAPAAAGPLVTGKNPVLALVLSFLFGAFGVGQFYNGDWKKGLAMLGATVVLGLATGGLVTVAVWIWSMVDAYQVASGAWRAW